jgi:hypothetical protein
MKTGINWRNRDLEKIRYRGNQKVGSHKVQINVGHKTNIGGRPEEQLQRSDLFIVLK